MAHIGHPLIGDKRYGGPNVVKFTELENLHGRKGHLLHAQEISFSDSQKKIHDIGSQKCMFIT
jgi:23S rRNA-/tRNA-specific pseudouridylate synthase